MLLTAMVLFSCLMANQKVPNSDANGTLEAFALSRLAWYSAAWPGTQQLGAQQPGLVISSLVLSSLAWYSATRCSAAWPGTQQSSAEQPGLVLSNSVLSSLAWYSATQCSAAWPGIQQPSAEQTLLVQTCMLCLSGQLHLLFCRYNKASGFCDSQSTSWRNASLVCHAWLCGLAAGTPGSCPEAATSCDCCSCADAQSRRRLSGQLQVH